ncbi:hypothetical protein [Actinoallomurus sp. NPDC050550]|uniref:hypothetical protein n=1 Tax=Actinoallomurus sp. NPDC050550 TaxID=3154937 RepID=UPI0033F0E2C4
MTTPGSGAPPGEPFGGSAVRPDPKNPRPGTPRRSGRDERRRISERLAEAAEEPAPDGRRVPGVPTSSPWQRSNAVWHRAGIDWSRGEPQRRPSPPASVPVAASAAAYPSGAPPAPPASPAPPPASPAPPAPPATPPAESPAADAEPWTPPQRARRLPSIPVRPVAIAAAAVVVLGGGAYALFGTGGGDKPKKPAIPAAVAADRVFTLDPAAKTSGRAHALAAVAAAGDTVVAIGSEQGGVYSRAQFLTSSDGGRTWRAARVRGDDGGDPPAGEYPQLVAGGGGAWAALGVTSSGVVSWTSRDARSWKRTAVAGAFGPGDKIDRLVRTRSGFVAAGTAAVKGGTQPIVWTSRDGRTWSRIGPEQLSPPSAGTPLRIYSVAAYGDTVVAEGTLRTTTTVTKTVKKKKKTVQQTTDRETFWRSPDSGRSWAPVTIPQAQGSSGSVVALAATRSGLFAAREASRTTGSKKNRKTTAYAVIFGSADGQTWAPVGQLGTDGYSHLVALRGADGGLAALAAVGGGRNAALSSADGKSWRRAGDVPPGRVLTDVAPATAGPVVTGRIGTADAYLTVAGVGDVNLTAVPDAVHPERTLSGLVADAGRVLAVGSSNGDAALWTSADGSAWTRATLPAGAPPRQILDAVHGTAGWLAVGHAGGRPLVLMSADGGSWQNVQGGKAFDTAGLAPVAAAANGGAYVVVGRSGDGAGAWFSTDLKNWAGAGSAGKGDLPGTGDAPRWMGDVTAGSTGFVAVGGQTKNKTAQPAVWTSPDGKKWTLSPAAPTLPQGAAAGSLTSVVARNGVLVATGVTGAAGVTGPPAADAPGTAAFAEVSADGGRTWQPVSLPGAGQGTAVTAATATAHGFVLAGAAGSDVVLWTSADGRTWRSSRPAGLGLNGLGTQRLTGLTVTGGTLVGVGFTGDASGDVPTLWRRPIP